jgi:hypothetical protein
VPTLIPLSALWPRLNIGAGFQALIEFVKALKQAFEACEKMAFVVTATSRRQIDDSFVA